MADYQTIELGSLVPRGFPLVAKASGSAIIAGTVNYYLKALTGTNAGKWWRDSDQTWQVAETANAMTYQSGDSDWTRAFAATSPFTISGACFLEYAKESGSLHVPVSRYLKAESTPNADTTRASYQSNGTGAGQISLVAGAVASVNNVVNINGYQFSGTGMAGVDTLGNDYLNNGAVYATDKTGGALATAAALTTAYNAILGLNNLSALANLYGPQILEIPDSSSTLYPFTLTIKDSEGHLVDLDATPTITATNAAGTSRSANLSAITHAATGRYTFTYSVASSAVEEGLRISASGAVSSSARYIEIIIAVANYDSITTLAAIKTTTDLLATTWTVTNGIAAFTASTLALAPTGSSGSGAYTIVQPVTDGITPLQNVTVSMTLNGVAYTATTDSSGNATFNLSAGTYTRAAVLAGYQYAGDTKPVVGSATLPTIVMTAITVPAPSSSAHCTVHFKVPDNTETGIAGVSVSARMVKPPSGAGNVYQRGNTTLTTTSDSQGMVYLDCQQTSRWGIAVAGAAEITVDVPAAATYELPADYLVP